MVPRCSMDRKKFANVIYFEFFVFIVQKQTRSLALICIGRSLQRTFNEKTVFYLSTDCYENLLDLCNMTMAAKLPFLGFGRDSFLTKNVI